jgi:hypothetical protein
MTAIVDSTLMEPYFRTPETVSKLVLASILRPVFRVLRRFLKVHIKNGGPALVQGHLQILDPNHVVIIVEKDGRLLCVTRCNKQQADYRNNYN